MFKRLIAFIMSIVAIISGFFGMSKEKFNIYTNIYYGEHERQSLNLYLPKENDGELGLVLFIHGGAWIAGSKDGYTADYMKSVSNEFGCAVAAINYRYISETVNLNDIMDDIDAALVKIKAIAADNDVNIGKVLLTGASAGGHLSLLYAYSRCDNAAIKPVAVVSYCGPTDLADENYYHGSDLGTPEQVSLLMSWACGKNFTPTTIESAAQELAFVSPITYVNENTVPTVIAHGMKDTVVPFSNAVTLDEKLTQFGVKHDFVPYPNSNHDLGSDPDCAQVVDGLLREYVAYLK